MNKMYPVVEVNPDDSQFYCCFGKCHVLKGAKIIAIIFAVNFVLRAVFSLVSLANANPPIYTRTIIVVSCLWYGLTKEREGFLIPFFIYMIICMIVIGTRWISLIIDVHRNQENLWRLSPQLALMLLMLVISFSLSMLVFCTVKRAYSYIKQKRRSQSANTDAFVSVLQIEQGYALSAAEVPPPSYEDAIHLEKK